MKTFPLVYITIPPELREKIIGKMDAPFNPDIPLPVEFPPGMQMGQIEAEMILSGLLQELAGNPGGKNSGYYRNLVFSLKPEIAGELQEAAIIKAKNGDHKTSLEIFDLLFGLKGQDPQLLLNHALILEECAAPDTAEAAYEKALANPAPDTFFYASLFYDKQGNFSRAASCLELYVDTVSEDEEFDTEDSKYIKAKELLAEIRTNGLDDNTFMEAVALIREGEEEKGINKAKDFLERHPGAGRAWFILGWGLRCLSRWKDAVSCFEKAIELGCVNADSYNELAICRLETGDLVSASRELEKALQLDPDNIKIISNMGILAMKQGNEEKALAFFRAALELDPDDPIAVAYLGSMA